MDKRQGILAALLGLVIVAGLAFWWMTKGPEMPPVAQPTPAAAPMQATVSAPLTANEPASATTVESDAVALQEEVVDQIHKENEELTSRAADLEAQAQDGEALLALKEKQIRELEAQLKQLDAGGVKKP